MGKKIGFVLKSRRGRWPRLVTFESRRGHWPRLVNSFIHDDSGQGIVEYILLLSAIVVGTSVLIRGMLKAVGDGVLTMGGAIEKDLKTGRAELSVWSN